MQTVRLRFRKLDLILTPQLSAEDIVWMQSFSPYVKYTNKEVLAVIDRLLDLVLKCAHDHLPNLTKEELFAHLRKNPRRDFPVIAVALLQVAGAVWSKPQA